MKVLTGIALMFVIAGAMFAQQEAEQKDAAVSVVGYLRDSACAIKFKEFYKPADNGCLESCVRAGSPLVLLTKDDQVYLPISTEIPDKDVRGQLTPYLHKLVKITGHVYERGGSKAITLEKIEEQKDPA